MQVVVALFKIFGTYMYIRIPSHWFLHWCKGLGENHSKDRYLLLSFVSTIYFIYHYYDLISKPNVTYIVWQPPPRQLPSVPSVKDGTLQLI